MNAAKKRARYLKRSNLILDFATGTEAKQFTDRSHQFYQISTPCFSATVKMSLSPRQHRLARMTLSCGISLARLATGANEKFDKAQDEGRLFISSVSTNSNPRSKLRPRSWGSPLSSTRWPSPVHKPDKSSGPHRGRGHSPTVAKGRSGPPGSRSTRNGKQPTIPIRRPAAEILTADANPASNLHSQLFGNGEDVLVAPPA